MLISVLLIVFHPCHRLVIFYQLLSAPGKFSTPVFSKTIEITLKPAWYNFFFSMAVYMYQGLILKL